MDTKRFNNPEYKNQIRAVRNYKRQVPVKPENRWDLVLFYIGLTSWKRRIFAAIILAAAVYLAYFANFLMFRDPEVLGADSGVTEQVKQNFADYKHTFKGILPQKNILFFSKSGFAEYLTANNYQVASVKQIKESFWHSIQITVEQRVPLYALQNGDNYFILNSDQVVGIQIPADQAAQYIPFKDTADEQVHPGEKFLDEQRRTFLEYIKNNIGPQLSLDIAGYEVPGRAADQLVVNLKRGFKAMFTDTGDAAAQLDRMYKVWVQFTPDQQNRLAYIDLRFDKNVYVCFKNDVCNK